MTRHIKQQYEHKQQQQKQQYQFEDDLASLRLKQEEYKQRKQQLEDEMMCWKGKNNVLEQEIKQKPHR